MISHLTYFAKNKPEIKRVTGQEILSCIGLWLSSQASSRDPNPSWFLHLPWSPSYQLYNVFGRSPYWPSKTPIREVLEAAYFY